MSAPSDTLHTLDARQRAMLAEMGLRMWLPQAPVQAASSPLASPQATQVAQPTQAPDQPTTHTSASTPSTQTLGSQTLGTPGIPLPHAAPPGTSAQEHAQQTEPPPSMPPVAVEPVAPQTTPQPTAASLASLGWPELQAAVASCQACRLCEGRTQTVFGVGAQRADWLVVGEAPGEQEDLRGEPFVGPAGQLLDAMLAAVGVSRQAPAGAQAVYIANVLKCRPPGNRNPAPDEVAQCEHFLRQQVALLQPKIILALGRFAVQSLLGTTEPIGRLRQQVHHYQGVPVIVGYHPAYLLRNLPDKAKAWADLVLAMKVARESVQSTQAIRAF